MAHENSYVTVIVDAAVGYETNEGGAVVLENLVLEF